MQVWRHFEVIDIYKINLGPIYIHLSGLNYYTKLSLEIYKMSLVRLFIRIFCISNLRFVLPHPSPLIKPNPMENPGHMAIF